MNSENRSGDVADHDLQCIYKLVRVSTIPTCLFFTSAVRATMGEMAAITDVCARFLMAAVAHNRVSKISPFQAHLQSAK